jgi:hypothetical protein
MTGTANKRPGQVRSFLGKQLLITMELPRVICVTIALSYNRGSTIAQWLRRSLLKRKVPAGCLQTVCQRRLIRHVQGEVLFHLNRRRCGQRLHCGTQEK